LGEPPLLDPELLPLLEPETPLLDPEKPLLEPEAPLLDPEMPLLDPELLPSMPLLEPENPLLDPEKPLLDPETPLLDPAPPPSSPRSLTPRLPGVPPGSRYLAATRSGSSWRARRLRRGPSSGSRTSWAGSSSRYTASPRRRRC